MLLWLLRSFPTSGEFSDLRGRKAIEFGQFCAPEGGKLPQCRFTALPRLHPREVFRQMMGHLSLGAAPHLVWAHLI